MAQINIGRSVKAIPPQNTTAYTPVIEAIVNSIHSIEESGRKDGQITVNIFRSKQKALNLGENASPPIKTIEITDNGIGFNSENRDAFDELYTDKKIDIGGKGFGRLTFLQYFDSVGVSSVFKDANAYKVREFAFTGRSNDFIENEKVQKSNDSDTSTKVVLENLKDEYTGRLNKKLETVARHIFEQLLIFFVNEQYECPQILIHDELDGEISLNDYLGSQDEIKRLATKTIEIGTGKDKKKFDVDIFKILYTQTKSSIMLSAHNRVVTKVSLSDFIPEAVEDFTETYLNEEKENSTRNYSIKTYVRGAYLDDNVSVERGSFHFSRDNENDMLFPHSQKEIEENASKLVYEEIKDIIVPRQNKKKERIQSYVDTTAPWHKSYVKDLDIDRIPYKISDVDLEGELQKVKFEKEAVIKARVNKILDTNEVDKVQEEVQKITEELNDIGKADLAHYVVSRKVVIDLLEKSLKWGNDKKFEKEKVVHSIIFPMNTDSDRLPYDNHNLWIIDEGLAFSEYVSSDQSLQKGNDKRPDLLVYDHAIAVREDNVFSNPITIFELKRPQREEYGKDEDPILQLLEYVEQIRQGKVKNYEGRDIKANGNTPAYVFLVCDLTAKIKKICKQYSLSMSPDQEGYFGYQSGYDTYVQVLSYDKLVKDADQRNKIFFKKLGIE